MHQEGESSVINSRRSTLLGEGHRAIRYCKEITYSIHTYVYVGKTLNGCVICLQKEIKQGNGEIYKIGLSHYIYRLQRLTGEHEFRDGDNVRLVES